ncbi:MAG: hypothetical protein C0608_01160 [Deltaproteobacteria bacterium]|nr:MAG: hypothetical protein C0608_01160 [Deltaproteobacteria bacterium]
MKKWLLIPTALSLLVVFNPAMSQAADFRGRLTTAVEFFDSPDGDAAVPAYLYGWLNGKNLFDAGYTMNFYGRLADDLNGEVDRDSRLYFAYLEKKEVLPDLSFRLGRQFATTTAGSLVLDGLQLEYSIADPYSIKAFAGGSVSFDDDYEAGDMAYGAEFRAKYNLLDVGLSYFQERDDSDLAKEMLGLDVVTGDKENFELSADLQYSLILEQATYFFGEAIYFGNDKYQVKAHYLWDVPVFDTTSIYSVFAASQYEELGAQFLYRFGGGLRAIAAVTSEMYEDFDNAYVYEAGFERIGSDWSGYLFGTYRDDEDGQDLRGIKAKYQMAVNKYFKPGVGIHADVLERRLDDDDETTSTRMWAFVRSDVTDDIWLEAKVEHAESELYDEYNLARLRFNYRF